MGSVRVASGLAHLPGERLGEGSTEQENVTGTHPLILTSAASWLQGPPLRLTVPLAAVTSQAGLRGLIPLFLTPSLCPSLGHPGLALGLN